jgi:hypothetical protein
MAGKYSDNNGEPIKKGFYRSNSGGIFQVLNWKNEEGKFLVIDSSMPEKTYEMAQHLAFKLTRIENPEYEIERLRDNANFIQSKLEQLAKTKTELSA